LVLCSTATRKGGQAEWALGPAERVGRRAGGTGAEEAERWAEAAAARGGLAGAWGGLA